MIALDFLGTTHLSASHNVALNQISPSTANLKPSLTGHENSAVSLLEVQIHKLTLTEKRSGKMPQKASNEQALRFSSNPQFQSPNWYQSVEKLKRSSAPPISFKTTSGQGGNRRKSATVNSSYRGIRRMEIRDISCCSSKSVDGNSRYLTTGTHVSFNKTTRNVISKQNQNDIVATNQNDVASLQQLVTITFATTTDRNALNNPDASETKSCWSPSRNHILATQLLPDASYSTVDLR
ncbi:hypothetical protein F511_20042 [Dorcoceras hygrometricum]|uniref:Uncharacterized protein n=1 Tax=Dorcoceras hygrometricum TaxID=472368 RepID=A0A2Z7CFI1_9LAMI|nr:hypothetical protein F511_20042 [Dorcoceras hygrometricum]